jgi:hypothetical protein
MILIAECNAVDEGAITTYFKRIYSSDWRDRHERGLKFATTQMLSRKRDYFLYATAYTYIYSLLRIY